MSDITLLLHQIDEGDAHASEALLPLVYDELRRLAAAKLARESAAHTLQPTALVHEAWLRLGGEAQPSWQNRRHFLGAAAEAMRRILIDRARSRAALRHGGGLQRVTLAPGEDLPGTDFPDERLLALADALEKFALVSPERNSTPEPQLIASANLVDPIVTGATGSGGKMAFIRHAQPVFLLRSPTIGGEPWR